MLRVVKKNFTVLDAADIRPMVSLMPTWMHKKHIGRVTLVGYSRAGEETVIGVPELNVCFDAGRAPREIISIDNLCISHGHMDHAAGVAYYLSQRGFIGAAPGRVIVHRDQAVYYQRLMEVWAEIEGHHAPGEIEGVLPGQDVNIRRGLIIRPFAVEHRGQALGFAVIETRHKLKPEFVGQSGPRLVELKRKNVQIEDWIEVPLVAYCGDTAAGDFLDLAWVRDAGVLILECTFFDHDHLKRARVGAHIHVSDLREILSRVRTSHVVLIHLTRRTDLRRAKTILQDAVAAGDLDRISFLMDRPPRRPDHANPPGGNLDTR